MSVLVTGGLGFIGSKVALQLVKKGIPTIVTDLDPMTNKKKLEKNLKKIDIKSSKESFYLNNKKLSKQINEKFDTSQLRFECLKISKEFFKKKKW